MSFYKAYPVKDKKNPLTDPEFIQVINKNEKVSKSIARLFKMDPDPIEAATLFSAIQEDVASELETNSRFKSSMEYLAQMIADKHLDTNSNFAAAMILSGASIVHSEMELRGDLSSVLIPSRSRHSGILTKMRTNALSTDGRAYMDNLVKIGEILTFEDRLVAAYKVLISKGGKEGKYATKVKQILTDESISLPFPSYYRDLNPSNLEKFYPEINRTTKAVGPLSTREECRKNKGLTAPTSSTIKFKDISCEKSNESTKNEVQCWVQYYSLVNKSEVYNRIDNAVTKGNMNELDLDMEWELETFEATVGELVKGRPKPPVLKNGEKVELTNSIYKGFNPWMISATCTELDDEEYDAVSEVFETVGAVAQMVAMVAGTIASCSGPTPAAAAAAAVASAAEQVKLVCDLAEGVIDIVNFFDTDDYLGDFTISNKGDYLLYEEDDYEHSPKTRENGVFKYSFIEITEGESEPFYRLWRAESKQFKLNEKHVNHAPGGNSDDDAYLFDIPWSTHDTINVGKLTYESEIRGSGNVYWKIYPHIHERENQIHAVVSWGAELWSDIEYWCIITCMKFTKE
jgi:hypothetical protein